MMKRDASFIPLRPNSDFVPLGRVTVQRIRIPRGIARSGYRVYRGKDGFEAAIPVHVLDRILTGARNSYPNETLWRLAGKVCDDSEGLHVVVLGVVRDCDANCGPQSVASSNASAVSTRDT